MNQIKIGAISFQQKPSCFETYLEKLKIYLEKARFEELEIILLPGNIGVEEIVSEKEWFSCHQDIAKKLNSFLIPGPIKNSRGKWESVIFDRSGAEIGRQEEISRQKDGRIRVFPTELGNLGLALGRDLYLPEYGRVLGGMGADIVLAPLRDKEKSGAWRWALKGLWREVQQNQFWGIEAGCEIRPGGIFGPCEATRDRTGILNKGWGLIHAVFDPEKRKKAKESFPVAVQLSRPTVKNYLGIFSGSDE